jgi:hypothetical protein
VVVATRRSAPDWYFRQKYHYRPYASAAVLNWMNAAGWGEVQRRQLGGIARFFAQAYAGVKL